MLAQGGLETLQTPQHALDDSSLSCRDGHHVPNQIGQLRVTHSYPFLVRESRRTERANNHNNPPVQENQCQPSCTHTITSHQVHSLNCVSWGCEAVHPTKNPPLASSVPGGLKTLHAPKTRTTLHHPFETALNTHRIKADNSVSHILILKLRGKLKNRESQCAKPCAKAPTSRPYAKEPTRSPHARAPTLNPCAHHTSHRFTSRLILRPCTSHCVPGGVKLYIQTPRFLCFPLPFVGHTIGDKYCFCQ